MNRTIGSASNRHSASCRQNTAWFWCDLNGAVVMNVEADLEHGSENRRSLLGALDL
jgi:hypothetical protein